MNKYTRKGVPSNFYVPNASTPPVLPYVSEPEPVPDEPPVRTQMDVLADAIGRYLDWRERCAQHKIEKRQRAIQRAMLRRRNRHNSTTDK